MMNVRCIQERLVNRITPIRSEVRDNEEHDGRFICGLFTMIS